MKTAINFAFTHESSSTPNGQKDFPQSTYTI